MSSMMSNLPSNALACKIATFLADYASLLLGCGATCIRIEKNTRRIADAFGVGFDISIMPNHVYVSVRGTDPSVSGVALRRTANCGISFNLNAQLSRLSWEVADNHLDFVESVERLDKIRETKSTGKWEVLLLTSLANASFCRLFGGDAVAMLIVFISTLAGYRLKQIMLEDKRDVRLTFLCASFFSAALSAGGHVFDIGTTPEIALSTSVLYLIPGVPYINAVSDMLYRHYLCGFSRFLDALVLTACLSVGLCAGMFILGLNWF
ncbi:Inner membrane protein YjjP [Porphyromonas levii]|nr:Inner membrane protein YjjP [Porphyromonas levii]MBR8774482.1 Inner membrane protein YjjP [Porphyromonas levii]